MVSITFQFCSAGRLVNVSLSICVTCCVLNLTERVEYLISHRWLKKV